MVSKLQQATGKLKTYHDPYVRVSGAIFVIAFATIGAHLLFSSHAATPTLITPSQNLSDISVAQIELDNSSIMAMDRGIRANPNNTSRIVNTLASVTSNRKNLILGLFKSNPSKINNLFLSDTLLTDLGSVADNALEKKVTLTGTWQTIEADGIKGQESISYQLTTSGGTYSLYTNGQMPSLNAGDTVSVKGYELNNDMFIPASSSTSQAKINILKDPTSSGTGTFNTAVIVYNFANTSNSENINMSQVKATFNGAPGHDVDDYFQENSYGQAIINPTFYGPVTVNENGQFNPVTGTYDACPNPLPSPDILNSVAASSGFNPANYQRVVDVLNCNQGDQGEAGIGCSPAPCYADVFADYPDYSEYSTSVYVHELSHTFGSGSGNESSFFQCGSEAFIPPSRFENNCLSEFDGNAFEGVGNFGWPGAPDNQPGHLDATHKNEAGWFSSSNYLNLSTPGTYTYKLLPYETPTNGLLALNIPRGNTGTSFTLEYRQPVGFDSWITPTSGYCPGCNITKGVMINFDYLDNLSDTQAIDTNPGGFNSPDYWDAGALNDGALTPGKSFNDPETGISVTTNSADSTGATVTVNVPAAATCTRNQPTVSTGPSNTTVALGQPLTFTYNVTSNDSPTCSPEKYKITSLDNVFVNTANHQLYNFFGTASPDVLSLSPGQSTTVTVSYIPDAVNPAGEYNLPAQNQMSSNGYLSADSLQISDTPLPLPNFAYLTAPPDTTPPTEPTSLTDKILGAKTLQLNWAASSDNTGVVGYQINLSNGEQFLTNQTSYTVFGLQPSTNYTFTVQAYDANLNQSQPATVSATTPAKTETSIPSSNNVTLSATDHSVTVSWQPSYDPNPVVGYEVVGINGLVNGSFPEQNIIPSSVNSVTYTDLPSNTTYYATVIAVDGDGNFAGVDGGAGNSFSNSYINTSPSVTTAYNGTAPPTTPTDLHITSITPSKVNLAWQPSTATGGLAGYYIYRDGFFLAEATTNAYTDTSCGGTCSYYIEALDNSGNLSPDSYMVNAPNGLPNSSSKNNTIPTTSIDTPINGSTVSGTLSLSTSATDPVGINTVYLYVDSQTSPALEDLGSSSSTYTFSLDTTQYSNGLHNIWVVALDNANNLATANLVTVDIENGTSTNPPPPPPPTVNLSGIVTSKKAPKGLAKVSVVASTSGSGTTVSDTTGTNGTYTLVGIIPNQSYTYTFKLKGYKTKSVTEIYAAGTFQLNEILKKT